MSNVVFHSEDPNVFMVIEQERWCCFVYCPVTARGPKVQQIDTVTPPVSCQPLVLSYGFAASQLDNGQVSRYTIGAFQEHDPHDKDYNAEAHARYIHMNKYSAEAHGVVCICTLYMFE